MAYNILIVDDSGITRAAIKRTVKMADLELGEIYEADNGKAALAVLDDNWIDLVMADLNMPEMGGIEMTQRMKENEDTQSIPVVVISTEASSTRIDELKAIGIKGYVHKPFTPEQIRDVVEEILGGNENDGE